MPRAERVRPEVPGWVLALSLGLASLQAIAQAAPGTDLGPEQVPLPPPLRLERLIPLEMRDTSLRFGVVPESVTIEPDGVVRYVVVARSPSGAVNAMHEGLRCGTGDVTTYARHNPDTGWVAVRNPIWQDLRGNSAHRHSLLIARTGACLEHAPNQPAQNILRDLQRSADLRFRPEAR